ncbi:hypothetical protein [Helicobacter zhangjianzhongii]|uniref:Uncharacterized protein n=1 Tax=Helicobacter zhangjianzhongii TaxID=2974574 RepID=A0ACC6FSQ6_9HELI|nr:MULTISPECIES: hypothetical protein [unclassified Helicobacter]MDL0079933.1 hypothetical protein [Helicobacter sp. CPD2-1]MDL0081721.1 hypothetical protein [Helicobacter sp. XJK30-2]
MAYRDKHLTKKGIITIIVLCLCALVIYLIWGKGSLYLLQSSPEPKATISKESTQDKQEDNTPKKQDKESRLCMLNDGKCQVIFMQDSGEQQEHIKVSIEAIPRNIISLESVVFRVEGAELSNLTGKIIGLNMDMGETIVRFNKVDDLLYEGRAIMASCTQEVMQYRMYLSTQDGATEAVDFDAKRKE